MVEKKLRGYERLSQSAETLRYKGLDDEEKTALYNLFPCRDENRFSTEGSNFMHRMHNQGRIPDDIWEKLHSEVIANRAYLIIGEEFEGELKAWRALKRMGLEE